MAPLFRLFTIAWDGVPGAQSYGLHQTIEESGAQSDTTYATTSAVLTRSNGQGIGPQVTYEYEVKACAGANGAGPCSDYRGTATVIVGPPLLQPQGTSTLTASAYDPFGKVRNGSFGDRQNGTLNLLPYTLRGFTGHNHVDDVQLIHMGGRRGALWRHRIRHWW